MGGRSAALGALARHACFSGQDFAACIRTITETAAAQLGVQRASVWIYQEAGAVLECIDLFLSAQRRHDAGMCLDARRQPAYFEALQTERVISAPEVGNDPRVADFSDEYHVPLGIRSLLDAPILHHGRMAGVLCCETVGTRRDWTAEDEIFASSLADFAALAFANEERRRVEEERRRTEQRLRLAISVTRSAVWDNDLVTGESWWSPEYYAMLGLPEGEPPPGREAWKTLIHPADLEEVLRRDARALAGHEPLQRQIYRMVRADGHEIWVEDAGHLSRDDQGRPIRWTGIKSDVTDRVHAERALRSAEERFRGLFENAMEGIWQMDAEGRLLEVNPSLTRMLGYAEPAELVREAPFAPALFAEREYWDELTRQLRAHDRVVGFEAELLRRDGLRIWASLNLRIARGAAGRPVTFDGSVADVTHAKRAEARLAHAALHDGLTGLPNRHVFLDRLGQALARSQRPGQGAVAVILADSDNLRLVNDSLGHAVTDSMVVEQARRLGAQLRPGDTLARLGGSEFAVLAEGLEDAEAALAMAEAMREALGAPFLLEGHEVFCSACFGVAIGNEGGRAPEDLLRDAGIALHQAKAQGRGRSLAFSSRMRDEPIFVLRLQSDLRRALREDAFQLHYQPVIEFGRRAIVGFEALIRWHHPQRGPLSPALFIPIAEEAGLMVELGTWVMRRAFTQLARWQEGLPPDLPFSLSINMAPSQLADPALFGIVDRLLEETGANPGRIKIEITETTLAGDADLVAQRLRGLRDRGLAILIDDFGTGYSSLGRLHRFPIDGLKIDQSFIRPMLLDGDSAAIVRSIVALGKALGLTIIAEGVEDEPSARELARLDCDYAQGYLFSRPVPEADAGRLVADLRAGRAGNGAAGAGAGAGMDI
jgi:diguanylate cyclase (GGDEF)-like protein/PAS domain S-box-containing protein